MGILSFLLGKTRRQAVSEQLRAPIQRALVDLLPLTPCLPEARIHWREGSFPMHAVGESNYQDALIYLFGRYRKRAPTIECEAVLELEPANPHDANVVVVVNIRGKRVGQLSKIDAARVGGLMREGGLIATRCAARVRGGWRTNQNDEDLYGVRLGIPNRGWIDFGIGAAPPSPPRRSSTRPKFTPGGPLDGHRVTLLGAPDDGEVARELAAAGARIMSALGRTTTLLVVVDDLPFSGGVRRSQRFRLANKMIADGAPLQILSLSEIRTMADRHR